MTKEEIISLLSPYANEMEDSRLGEFLTLSVGRVLLKSKDRIHIEINDLDHISDWLKSAIINNDAWLSNVDAENRPKKLMKFSSIEGIVQEADKAMLIASQKLIGTKLEEGDEELFAELTDGYYIVKLLTSRALDKESAQMQHCIGQGAYDEFLDDDSYQFLSLRDSSGNPHVTIQIYENKEIDQIQGKQNKCPNQKYMDILVPYFQEQNFNHILPLSDILYAIDINKKWHRYDQIPDNTTFDRTLNFIDLDIKELPKNMKLINKSKSFADRSNLFLDETEIVSLPDGLECEGGLYLNSSTIEKLPRNLKVGSLFLNDTFIKELPEGLYVKEYLDANRTYKLEHISDDLYVGSKLSLEKSNVKKLPNGIDVFCLNLASTKIKEIPENTIIKESLDIASSEIIKLPENIKYYYSLIAFNSKLESLPENLHVKHDLVISNSMVKTLPKGLNVGNTLRINRTAITALPEDIKAKTIELNTDQIDRVPDICVEMNTLFIFNDFSATETLRIKASDYQIMCDERRKSSEHKI